MKTIKNAVWGLLVFAALALAGCPGLGLGMLNYTALDAAIANANALKAGVEVSINGDGSDVSPAKEWVIKDAMDAFEFAVSLAATTRSQAATQGQVDDAAALLNTAINIFNSAKKDGTKPAVTDDLNVLIGIAEALMAGVRTSADGGDIDTNIDWVTQSVWNALESAIENAKAGGNIAEAYTALLTAKNTFENAMKKGTLAPIVFTVNNSAQGYEAIISIINGGHTSYVINITGSFEMDGGYDGYTFGDRSGITVTINGNHTISLSESSKGNLFRINENQTVIANDIILKGHLTNDVPLVILKGNLIMRGSSEIWNNKSDWGGGIRVEESGVFIMESGRIYQNVGQYIGGGVHITSGAEFIMKGGEISYNTVIEWDGGGVNVSQSKFTMEGGEIHNNTAKGGGGVKISNEGEFVIRGNAKIYNNTATEWSGGGVAVAQSKFAMEGNAIIHSNTIASEWGAGGGVHINQSIFTMGGGEMYGNIAKIGAGVFCEESEFIMRSNAKIHNNTATEWDGGGVCVVKQGKFTMEGGEISYNTAKEGGAGVHIREESEFIMSGNAIIRNNTASWDGGGVHVGSGKFTMGGGEISYNTATGHEGGGVFVRQGSLIMAGGEIHNNTAKRGAGVRIGNEGEFIMRGNAIIRNNTATEWDGGGVYLYQSKFTMESGEISYNTAGAGGGGVFVHLSKFTMEGGKISYNTAKACAGVGVLGDESEFIMRGNSIINNNTATEHSGGGVHVRQSSFVMEGNAIIRNNTAVQQEGGGVIIWQSNFTMAGGEISDNTAGGGGGVKINEESEFIMSGNAIIRNNTALWAGGGVNVHHQSKFTMEGGEISDNTAKWGAGVEIGGGSEFTMSNSAKIHNNIATEGEGGGVLVDQSKFTMTSGEISHNTANGAGGVRIGNESEFIMSGNAKIHNNAATEGVGEGGGVLVRHSKFTMEGGEISYNTARIGGGVNIREEGEFVMSGNAKINNNTATEHDGGGVQVYRGKFTMAGGEISYNTAKNGAGVGINGLEGEFIMSGSAIIRNNTATEGNGGGVVVVGESKFTMEGGEIHNNTANNGAGVNIGDGEFIMRGNAKIHNNTVTQWDGGGVYVARGKFTMESGEISYNIANSGAGVQIRGEVEFIMSGNAKIHNNTATEGAADGGGVLVHQGKLIMEGGEIHNNTANNGAGVHIREEGEFIMRGNAKIRNNTASWDGGGVYVYNSFTMEGGEISDNTATGHEGGGVFVIRQGSLVMAGGEIHNNTAKRGAGVSIVVESELIMSGNAKIHNNTATEWGGGGVHLYQSKFTMEGGEISYNTANSGAGVSLRDESEFIMKGGIIYGSNASEDLRNTAENGAALHFADTDVYAKYLNSSGALVDIPLDGENNRDTTIRVTNGVLTDN